MTIYGGYIVDYISNILLDRVNMDLLEFLIYDNLDGVKDGCGSSGGAVHIMYPLFPGGSGDVSSVFSPRFRI